MVQDELKIILAYFEREGRKEHACDMEHWRKLFHIVSEILRFKNILHKIMTNINKMSRSTLSAIYTYEFVV